MCIFLGASSVTNYKGTIDTFSQEYAAFFYWFLVGGQFFMLLQAWYGVILLKRAEKAVGAAIQDIRGQLVQASKNPPLPQV